MSDDSEIESEERAIYAIVAVVMTAVVIGVITDGAPLDGGAGLSLLLGALAIAGLVAGIRAVTRSRLPVARVHRRK